MKGERTYYSKMRFYIVGLLLVAVVLLLMLFLSRHKEGQVAAARKLLDQQIKAGPRVPVATALLSPGERKVQLTGEAHPYASVTLFAKVSGYLKEIRVDKGDRVKEGEVLAVIESPELDRQYDAAVADARNKRAIAERYKVLLKSDSISRQDAETAEATARIAEATEAQLKVQKGYEVLSAPFSATVTARFADPGALVQDATTSQTATLPLVSLSQTARLRIYVYLDQRNAAFVRKGDAAEVIDPARPEVRLTAMVNRISGELDDKTRTMLVELDLDNRRGTILPGGFVQVVLKLSSPPFVQIPAEALLMRGEKALAAVVGDGNRVTFRPLTIAESDGKTVRLSSGLSRGERVILNPGWGITEGAVVQPLQSQH